MKTEHDPTLGELVRLDVPVYAWQWDVVAQSRVAILIPGPVMIRADDLRRIGPAPTETVMVPDEAETARVGRSAPERVAAARKRGAGA